MAKSNEEMLAFWYKTQETLVAFANSARSTSDEVHAIVFLFQIIGKLREELAESEAKNGGK